MFVRINVYCNVERNAWIYIKLGWVFRVAQLLSLAVVTLFRVLWCFHPICLLAPRLHYAMGKVWMLKSLMHKVQRTYSL